MTTDTPTLDQLVAERRAAGDWTPDQLRPGFDLHDAIGRSYEAAMRRSRDAAAKARIKARRRSRRDRPLRALP